MLRALGKNIAQWQREMRIGVEYSQPPFVGRLVWIFLREGVLFANLIEGCPISAEEEQ